MPFHEQVLAELDQRMALLPGEIDVWMADAAANAHGMGIHGSQINALGILMDGLLKRQQKKRAQLAPQLPAKQFAGAHSDLVGELIGGHDLWRIFRHILAQHREPRLGRAVDAASLVAADCYRGCLERVRTWGLVSESQFREPPLVYLEAQLSPAAVSRTFKVEALDFPVRRYRGKRLPVPIVILPADHMACCWLLCTLHHEVGHNLDQDLKLSEELRARLAENLAGKPTLEMWQQWTGEILADAFGVLLGGDGFAHTLASILRVILPVQPTLDVKPPHPHPLVRLHLIAKMLERCKVERFNQAAAEIRESISKFEYEWAAEYLPDCDLVAGIVLDSPLDALGERPLRDLAPELDSDAQRAAKLAKYLRTGLIRPPPTTPSHFPWRLVPVAAQLAFRESDLSAETLVKIHERALKYLEDIPRPEWLAGVDRSDFLKQLVDGLDLRLTDSFEGDQP